MTTMTLGITKITVLYLPGVLLNLPEFADVEPVWCDYIGSPFQQVFALVLGYPGGEKHCKNLQYLVFECRFIYYNYYLLVY